MNPIGGLVFKVFNQKNEKINIIACWNLFPVNMGKLSATLFFYFFKVDLETSTFFYAQNVVWCNPPPLGLGLADAFEQHMVKKFWV